MNPETCIAVGCGSKLVKMASQSRQSDCSGRQQRCKHSRHHRGLGPDHVRTEGAWELERASMFPHTENREQLINGCPVLSFHHWQQVKLVHGHVV